MNPTPTPSEHATDTAQDSERPGMHDVSPQARRDETARRKLGLLDTFAAPLACRLFTQVGVVLNHLHVREARWRAREPMDDLDLMGDLRRMPVPERTGRLNPRAEMLLLLAFALDISDDARDLLRVVSPRYPYPCIRAIANLTGLTGDELEAFTRELEDDAPLVHFDLVEVHGEANLQGLAAQWLGGPVNLRRATINVTMEGLNFLLGLPLDHGLDQAPVEQIPWWAFWRHW